MIKLNYKGITVDGTYEFDIVDNKKVLGQLDIEDNYDYYIVRIESSNAFYTYNKKNSTNQKVNQVFESLDEWVRQNDLYDKPMLLAEDEKIANYYAATHNLIRVPRWYGFYY